MSLVRELIILVFHLFKCGKLKESCKEAEIVHSKGIVLLRLEDPF